MYQQLKYVLNFLERVSHFEIHTAKPIQQHIKILPGICIFGLNEK